MNRRVLAKKGEKGELRCSECNKLLGRSNGDKVDIKISKGKGKFMGYRVQDGAVSVKCLCGSISYLTDKAVFDIQPRSH